MSFCFSTFEIRSQHTQKSVDYNELDRLICEKFDLKYSNISGAIKTTSL